MRIWKNGGERGGLRWVVGRKGINISFWVNYCCDLNVDTMYCIHDCNYAPVIPAIVRFLCSWR